MSLEGMDAGEVRQLAAQMRNQAAAISGAIATVDGLVHQLLGAWNGRDASEFQGWWQQQHRPALVECQAAVTGLAQSADNNAQSQDLASSASAGSTQVLGRTVSLPPWLKERLHEGESFSERYGWAAGPMIAGIPIVGTAYSKLASLDSEARMLEDASHGNAQGTFNEGSNLLISDAYGAAGASKDPIVLGGAVDATLWQAVEQDAHAINWSYTIHHLSALNPAAPGAWQAVEQAEIQGFTSVGKNIASGLETSLVSFVTSP